VDDLILAIRNGANQWDEPVMVALLGATSQRRGHGEVIVIILRKGQGGGYHGEKIIHTNILLHQE